MSKWKPVPLPDGSYKDASKPFSDQDLQNYLVEFAETQGTRATYKLVCPPGLTEFALFGAGPHRGARDVEGNLFVVADTHAYWVKSASEIVQLGEIPGRSLVWIAHNQITNGNEVMFSTGPDAWIWNTVDETFTKVTDEAFRGARSLDYCNSRFLAIENQRRFFANSALAAGQEWDSLERYEAESCPDRLMCLVVSHNEVLVFNERTIEFFQNTTNPEDIANHILFTRVGLPVEVGCASVRGAVRLDNAVYFIGSDGGFFRLEGATPVRVSTHAIEYDWSQHDLAKAFCTVWEDRGHKVVYTTIPSGHTWGYDVATRKWHRRQSFGLNRWRLNTLFKWRGDWYGGSYNSGHLYKLDWDYTKEGCDELESAFTTGVLHDEGNRVTLHGLRIELDSGSAESVCTEVEEVVLQEPTGELDWLAVGTSDSISTSDDDGETWTDRTSGVTGGTLFGAAYGAGVYVVTGTKTGDNTILTSTDRITWTERTSIITGATANLAGVTFGEGLFVGVAQSGGGGNGFIQTSPDGITWTQRTAPASVGPLHAICYGGGKFVAVSDTGYAAVSADGINWGTRFAIGANMLAVAYDTRQSLFMAVGNEGAVYISSDGETWTHRVTLLGASGSFSSVMPSVNGWYAGTNNGAIGVNGIYRSTDNGANWTRLYSTSFHYALCTGNNAIVSGSGGGGGQRSTDAGAAWTAVQINTAGVDTHAIIKVAV